MNLSHSALAEGEGLESAAQPVGAGPTRAGSTYAALFTFLMFAAFEHEHKNK